MEIKNIKYSQGRNNMMGCFESLANFDWQMKGWVNPKAAHRFSDAISFYAFDELMDSYSFDEDAYDNIGQILYDEEEAEAVQEYCIWFLDLMNNVIGWNEPDEAYYKHPDWTKVVEGAVKIRKLMSKKIKKISFGNSLMKIMDMNM